MHNLSEGNEIVAAAQARLGRRGFMRNAGVFGLGAAAALALGTSKPALAQSESKDEQEQDLEQAKDTVAEIITAALIAEDLATTFYYHALTGPVIQDVNLAGTGGTATKVAADGNFGNVAYVRAALDEEVAHANVLRWALNGGTDASKDPYQTFYFPTGSFDTLSAFTGLLDALENAFISAYLNAIQELATKAAKKAVKAESDRDDTLKYTAKELEYYCKLAASIMGIECEHRVLGRVISNSNPANNRQFEQTIHLNAVYNGPASAVVALTPFLTPSTGPGYSLMSAVANQGSVAQLVGGHLPLY